VLLNKLVERINAHRVLVRQPAGKRAFERPRYRSNNIKMDLEGRLGGLGLDLSGR
jgi:hypothetical protein